MKKVLIVAYQFPPMGGSGVQRTTKFVKFLRDFEWEPIVFTRDIKRMILKDESLLNDIPDGIKVIRTNPWDFTELPGVLSLGGKVVARKILIPDGERLWQQFSRRKAVQSVIDEKVDLIYTTSYPYSDHLLGLYLKSKFPDIPWVADFRDEWTNNPYLLDNPHYTLRMATERKQEKLVLEKADYLITNTPVMLKNFINNNTANTELKNKFFVIPNGYDLKDFEGLDRSEPDNSRFTMTYTGALYGRRKPDLFFEALMRLIKENAIDRNKLQVKLIGNFKNDQLNEVIHKYSLDGVVQILPYMKHRDCIQHLLKSNALLLIEGAGPGAEAFYTGKVFEYMATGRAILAIIPENGAAAQLINDTGTGLVSDCRDLDKISENILNLYNSWLKHKSGLSPNYDYIRSFERKELTKLLSEVFDKAIEKVKK
jgi:glycosyltransferase involved in cell wall biosynthesis